jgi:hypothetical protein
VSIEASCAVGILPDWVDRQAYHFRVHTLELPAGRMSYVDEGRGPPLLLVHGTPTWSFEYRHLIGATGCATCPP